MICLSLSGGLGNQLFQLGAALRLARNNIEHITIDATNLGGRGYDLPKIFGEQILPPQLSIEELNQFKAQAPLYGIGDPEGGYFVDQKLLDSTVDFSSTHVYLRGYFQSGKNLTALKQYIDQHKHLIEIYKTLKPIRDKAIIHYRQGDYLKLDVQQEMGLINLSYIDRAIYHLKDHHQMFEIYSDELGLLQAYEEKNGVNVVVGNNPIETFTTFLSATTLVVPNSSFSLCAAYLSPYNLETYRPAIWSRKYVFDELTSQLKSKIITIPNSFYPLTQ
jgi:hypothetical protein